jgi:hypothetical protein
VGQQSKTSPDALASPVLLSRSAKDPDKGLFVGLARRNLAPNTSHMAQGSGDRLKCSVMEPNNRDRTGDSPVGFPVAESP